MAGKIRTRLALLVALAALTAVVVPATLALGSHDGDPIVGGEPGYLLMELGNTNEVTFGTTQTQPIRTNRNRCNVVDFQSPQLLTATAEGGELGYVSGSLGVRSNGDGNGNPCAWVEATDSEAISIKLGSAMSAYLMTAVDVDLELKSNAFVDIEFKHDGNVVATDSFDPTDLNDDGPDDAERDNWRYMERPETCEGEGESQVCEQIYFDEVKFIPTAGTLSIEGGSDGTDPGELVPGNNTSQFEVVPVFDGELTCGDFVTIQDPDVPLVADVYLHAMDPDTSDAPPYSWSDDPEAELDPCKFKPYLAALFAVDVDGDDGIVDESELEFVPELADTLARYTMTVTVGMQLVETNASGMITSLVATYDPDPLDETELDLPLLACESIPPGEPGATTSWTDQDLGLLPDNQTACYFHVQVETTGTNSSGDSIGTETWRIFFLDDPGVKFR